MKEIPKIETNSEPAKPSAVTRAKEDLARINGNFDKLLPHLEFADDLVELGFCPIEAVSIGTDFTYIILRMDDPTKDDLFVVSAYLSRHGYRADGVMDLEDCHVRIFRHGIIEIFAHFHEAGAACGFVQVGVKQQPVYEFKCQEQP